MYDPATGTWAARVNMPTARGLFGTSAVGGTIYAIGGTTGGRDKLAVVEAYDTATDTWTRRADMPTPRNALSAAVVDGKIYAIGGWGYDRPEGGWEPVLFITPHEPGEARTGDRWRLEHLGTGRLESSRGGFVFHAYRQSWRGEGELAPPSAASLSN